MANSGSSIRIALDLVASSTGISAIADVGNMLYGISQLNPGASMAALPGWFSDVAAGALAAAVEAAAFDSSLSSIIDQAAHLQLTTAQMDLALHGTKEEIAQLNPLIIQWADASLYSTAQVHQMVTALSEHGMTVKTIMEGAGQAAITLGEAIKADPIPAADLLASAMQVFSSQGLDATTAANVLTAAFYNGIPSAQGLQTAFEDAGGQAATMGVGIKDLSAVLDLLVQAGMRSESAGTGLRYMLQTLADPTTKAANDMNYLGLTTINTTAPALWHLEAALNASGKAGQAAVSHFDGTSAGLNAMYKEAQKLGLINASESFNAWAISAGVMSSKLFDAKGNFIGLGQAMQTIIDAVHAKGGGNKELETAIMGEMFNVRSGRSAEILANMTNFKGKYQAILNEMNTTSSKGDAGQLLNTLPGATAELQTTMSSFGAAMGAPLIGPLTQLIQKLNEFLSWLMTAHPHFVQFLGIFIAVGAVLATVTAIVLGIIAVFAILAALGVGAAVAGTFALVAAAIVGVAAVIALVIVKWHDITVAFQHGVTAIGGFFSWLGTQTQAVLSAVGAWFSWLGLQIKAHLDQAGQWIHMAWNSIVSFFQTGLKDAENLVSTVMQTIGGWFEWLYNHNYYFKDLVDFIRAQWQAIWDGAVKLWTGITTWLSDQWHIISKGASDRWNEITKNVGDTFDKLGTRLHDAVWGIIGILGVAWGRLQFDAQLVWDKFLQIIQNVSTAILTPVNNILTTIGNAIGGLATSMYNWASNAVSQFVKGIADGLPAVGTIMGRMAGAVAAKLGFHSPPPEGPLSDSDTYMPNMLAMFGRGITDNSGSILSPLTMLGQQMQGVTQNGFGFSTTALTSALNTARFQMNQLLSPGGIPLGAPASSNAGNQVVNVQVGNQQLFQLVMNQITGQMQLNGMGTAFH